MRRGQLLWSRSADAIHRALGRSRTGNLQGPSLPIETSGGSRGGTQPPFFSLAPSTVLGIEREREIQGLTIRSSNTVSLPFFFFSFPPELTIHLNSPVSVITSRCEYFRASTALGSEFPRPAAGPASAYGRVARAHSRYRAISGATGMRSELTTIRSHRRLSLLGCLEIAEPPSRLLSLSRQRRGLEVVSRRGRNNASRINSSPLKRLARLPRSSSKFVIPIARGGMTKFVSRSHPLRFHLQSFQKKKKKKR